MDRGVSTALDVAVACLLVTASATLLVTAPGPPPEPADADRAGRALLATTLDLDANGHVAVPTVGAVLVRTAHAGTIDTPRRQLVRERVDAVDRRLAVTVTGGNVTDPIVVGHRPPPGGRVDAAVFRVGAAGEDHGRSVVLTVRTWAA